MLRIKLFVYLLVISANAEAQELELYARSTNKVYSSAISDTFTLDVAIPKYFNHASSEVTFPLIILFDSYNTYTFSHHLKTIDMLTYHGQMPEAIVVGIPFTMQNRFKLTSLPMLDSLEAFVFKEVIPNFQEDYHATGPLLIFGHSRSAYAVGYFTMNNSSQFQASGVFSGFFDAGFDLATAERFLAQRSEISAPFAFYYSAGRTTREEETYLKDLEQLQDVFRDERVPQQLRTLFFGFGYANHMTNYNLSVEAALLNYFGPYNLILDEWIFSKLEKLDTASGSTILRLLYTDFKKVSEQLGGTLQPGISHILSISNHYINSNATKALPLLALGKQLYPGDYDLDYYLVEAYFALDKMKEARETIDDAKERLTQDELLTEAEKADWLEAFEDVLQRINEH